MLMQVTPDKGVTLIDWDGASAVLAALLAAQAQTFANAAAVTPDSGVVLPAPAAALYVGGAGSVTVITPNGQVATFANVPAGTTLRVRATRVMSTGTTATQIVALW